MSVERNLPDNGENTMTKKATEAGKSHMKTHNILTKEAGCLKNRGDVHVGTTEALGLKPSIIIENEDMEAAITTDDVIRAGGFGATDDIGRFLPVAMDSTDFEASLREARDFEGPQEKICRPGLGWTEPTASDTDLITSSQ